MAMSDLTIRPRVGGLRYASNKFDEFRILFDDLERRREDPKAVSKIIKRARGLLVSAKVTVENAIEDAIAIEVSRVSPDEERRDD